MIGWLRRMRRDRRGVTAVIYGIAGMAATMMVGLVIDFSDFMKLRTQLSLAADAGVLAGVTQAATQLGPNPSNYLSLGQQAGLTRFTGQAGLSGGAAASGQVSGVTQTLTLTRNGSTIQGTLSWQGTYTPYFAKLFGVSSWPMANTSASGVQVSTPFLNVYFLLDVSGSMMIGASNSDIAWLNQLSACSSAGAFYPNNVNPVTYTSKVAAVAYSNYACTSGKTYSGGLACPAAATAPLTVTSFPIPGPNTVTVTGSSSNGTLAVGPSCKGLLPASTGTYNKGLYPLSGPPCALACHWSSTGADFYGVARSTIGQTNPFDSTKTNGIQLRMDVLKAAVNNLLGTMQTDSQALNNINVAIYTFANAVTKVYPTDGSDAGNDWASAIAAVGGPPTTAGGADTGIQPPYTPSWTNAWTDIPGTFTTMANTYLTKAGGGTVAADPQKYLILVTDGLQDFTGNTAPGNVASRFSAIQSSYCSLFKNLGYTVFVLYTTYVPLMYQQYLSQVSGFVEGTGSSSVVSQLQACSSNPLSYYYVATSYDGINAAFQQFLSIALNTPARLTK